MTSGMAQVNGASLCYEVTGEGFPLVLAHAGFVDRRMWDGQVAAFAQRYRVVRYDRRGFGQSPPVSGPFSHRADLEALLAFLGIGRAHLLGCSAGGAMMLDVVLERPDLAASLVLVSSAIGGEQPQGPMPEPLQELMQAMKTRDLDRAAALAVQIWVAGPKREPERVDARIRDQVREMSLTGLPNAFAPEEALQPPATSRLGEIRVPTLVIVGDQDDDSVQASGERLGREISGAERVVLPSVAHLLNMEDPQDFNQTILDFLAQQDNRAPRPGGSS